MKNFRIKLVKLKTKFGIKFRLKFGIKFIIKFGGEFWGKFGIKFIIKFGGELLIPWIKENWNEAKWQRNENRYNRQAKISMFV